MSDRKHAVHSSSKPIPRIVLLVTDGVGFRNFVLGQLPALLSRDAEVVLLHNLPEKVIAEGLGTVSLSAVERMPDLPEGALARLLREAKSLGQIYWQYGDDAGDVQLRQRRPRGSWRSRLFGHLARLMGRIAASPKKLDLLDVWHEKAVRRTDAFDVASAHLKDLNPDLIFCTHQRASSAVAWMAAARSLGIHTTTFVYSWDNPPKGRMAVPSDDLILWGDQMLEELRTYYPSWPKERLHVVGTPQFEPYWSTEIRSREQFFTDLDLDPLRPLVCFSGGDFSSSPRDQEYLADLAEAARTFSADERPQILFRRSPVDKSGRYDEVLVKYGEIVDCPPLWRAPKDGDWQQILPTRADVQLLTEIVHHSDAVANLGSTMALDFALLGKPALYFAYEAGLRFDPQDASTFSETWSAHDTYRLPHFRLLHEINPVTWVRAIEDLPEALSLLLGSPQVNGPNRERWIDRILTKPVGEASSRIANTLLQLK